MKITKINKDPLSTDFSMGGNHMSISLEEQRLINLMLNTRTNAMIFGDSTDYVHRERLETKDFLYSKQALFYYQIR